MGSNYREIVLIGLRDTVGEFRPTLIQLLFYIATSAILFWAAIAMLVIDYRNVLASFFLLGASVLVGIKSNQKIVITENDICYRHGFKNVVIPKTTFVLLDVVRKYWSYYIIAGGFGVHRIQIYSSLKTSLKTSYSEYIKENA